MALTEMLPSAFALPTLDKIELIRALAEWLKSSNDLSGLNPNQTYFVYSPYESYGAGRVMLETLRKTNEGAAYTSGSPATDSH